MTDLSIALSGHRPKSLDGDYSLTSELWRWIGDETRELFAKAQPKEVVSGMALGYDTLGAMIALELGIPLIAAVPFKGQEKNWPDGSQALYHTLLKQAAEVHIISDQEFYAAKLFQDRNEWMVDRGDLLCAAWNGSRGGTNNCVEYAIKQQVPVWRIDPKTRKVGRYNGLEIIPKREVAKATV